MVQVWSESCIQVKVFIVLQLLALAVVLSTLHRTESADVLKVGILGMAVILPMLVWIWIISSLCVREQKVVAWSMVILVPLLSVCVAEIILW